jgi:putative hemolysin
MAEDGDKKAGQMLKLVQKPAGFLSTIQVCITLAGFLASAFAADTFSQRIASWMRESLGIVSIPEGTLSTVSLVFITLILSYFMLVLGELVPKRIAMQRPEQTARMAVGVIRAASVVFHPVVWLLSVSTNGILRLLHIDPNATGEAVSEDEIMMMVDLGEEKGAIESNEKEMIENIFEFNNMSAEDVMIHRTDMVVIWADESEDAIIQTIEESGLSRFPVCDEDVDDIIGILSTRDYLLNLRRAHPKPLRELLRPAYFVPESVRTDVLFRDMQSKKVHMAIVVDEYGGTSGLLTMEDLLEEIVGNIYDEFDPQDEQEIVQLEDNLWRVSGSADLELVAETLDVEFPDSEEYDTLGGLVYAQLSVIPEDGSHPEVFVHGLRIRVEEISDRRVEWALVSKEQPEEVPEE